jgi:hypothetical protein
MYFFCQKCQMFFYDGLLLALRDNTVLTVGRLGLGVLLYVVGPLSI